MIFFREDAIWTIADLPLALPPIVAGVGIPLIFGTTFFGAWLSSFGLKFIFTPYGIIIAQFTVNIAFMRLIMRSTFEGISPRYEYVAQTLGCNPMRADHSGGYAG